MKTINLMLLASCAVLLACHSNSSNSIALTGDSTKMDSVEAKFLIVPGQSIGKIYLGQEIGEVSAILGKADAGDAAMGSAWGIWYSNDSTNSKRNEMAVYSSYADSNMTKKDVKQIRITSHLFETKDRLNTGNSLSNFKAKYTDFEKLATYVDSAYGDSIAIYDSKSNGIGVEFIRDISRAITIHKKGTIVNQTYLTFHPEWKLIE